MDCGVSHGCDIDGFGRGVLLGVGELVGPAALRSVGGVLER